MNRVYKFRFHIKCIDTLILEFGYILCIQYFFRKDFWEVEIRSYQLPISGNYVSQTMASSFFIDKKGILRGFLNTDDQYVSHTVHCRITCIICMCEPIIHVNQFLKKGKCSYRLSMATSSTRCIKSVAGYLLISLFAGDLLYNKDTNLLWQDISGYMHDKKYCLARVTVLGFVAESHLNLANDAG